jgi:hypothetical protein
LKKKEFLVVNSFAIEVFEDRKHMRVNSNTLERTAASDLEAMIDPDLENLDTGNFESSFNKEFQSVPDSVYLFTRFYHDD